MNMRKPIAMIGTLLIAALLFLPGCKEEGEAFEEEFMATFAGWSASGTVTNTCKFGEGLFDNSNCDYGCHCRFTVSD